jgi:URI fold toxin 2
MRPHANSHENDALHHLYAIFDVERNTIYKYGICGKPLNSDGSSPRANEQTKIYNRVVGMVRFFSFILLIEIEGRKLAEEIEQEYIDAFCKKNGSNPRGNL